jgi:hypothetical protein
MSIAPPTVGDLAAFTGRPSNTFGEFAPEALSQATLLFLIATELIDYPSDTNLAALAKNGILDMADSIYLSQPYKQTMSSPFQSESIGSYSYSKMTKAVKKGDSTGVAWFDMAVSKLRAFGTGIGASGSIEGMEWDGIEDGPNGKKKIIGGSGSYSPYGRPVWEIDTWNEDVIHHHPIV